MEDHLSEEVNRLNRFQSQIIGQAQLGLIYCAKNVILTNEYIKSNLILTSLSVWAGCPLLAAIAAANSSAYLIITSTTTHQNI
jgi:hypothetical protein